MTSDHPEQSLSQALPNNISESASNPEVKDDLYRHINGEWLGTHVIPDDRGIDGAFHTLHDQAEQDVRELIEDAAKNEPAGRIGALYTSFMDEEGIAAAGLSVLDPDLNPIREAGSIEELADALGALDPVGISGVAAYWVEKDFASDKEIATLTQTGIGLPDEAYYREEQHAPVREAYVAFIAEFLELVADQPRPGRFAEASVSDAAAAIMDFETALAAGHWNMVDSRDMEKAYNPTAVADLPTGFPFARWVAATGIDTSAAGGETIIVAQPSYLEHVAELATTRELDEWKLWAYWRVVTNRASMLAQPIAHRAWEFYGRTLAGAEEPRARWKRGVSFVEGTIGEEVGKAFVAKHFPPEYKAEMLTLIDYLIAAYRERIANLPWMTPATRERALEKLSKFEAKVGYPDKWRSFDSLSFDAAGQSLLANVRQASAFNHEYVISNLGQPADKSKWHSTPQTVNAFYNPVKNDITFPAAILRPPFFDPNADMATNFGAIGAVIGHEIGHGFDDQGSKFDGDGNLVSWWSDEDREAFTALTDKLVAQYEGLIPQGLEQRGITDHKVNGQFTLGENIGDLGGLGIAVVALKRYLADQGTDAAAAEETHTALQHLFISWARVWRTAIRPQLSAQYVSIDPHSPAEFRCNVVSSNITEFYEAFDVSEGDGMWIAPEDRVQIW